MGYIWDMPRGVLKQLYHQGLSTRHVRDTPQLRHLWTPCGHFITYQTYFGNQMAANLTHFVVSILMVKLYQISARYCSFAKLIFLHFGCSMICYWPLIFLFQLQFMTCLSLCSCPVSVFASGSLFGLLRVKAILFLVINNPTRLIVGELITRHPYSIVRPIFSGTLYLPYFSILLTRKCNQKHKI